MEVDPLIRIGVAHYQFEAIHPFRDGNGRMGRLIIPLFLCQEELLQTPVLYVSHFFEEHKVEYQKKLHGVDTDQNWIAWLNFFLTAVETQARTTTEMARSIQNLYEEMKKNIIPGIKSHHAIELLDLIFSRPVTGAEKVRQVINAKSKVTTYTLLNKFVEKGVLQEIKIGRKKIYYFKKLMTILRR